MTAGCYGADSEGWFDPWALLQVKSDIILIDFVPFIILNHLVTILLVWSCQTDVISLQAFKVSAQHGGVEYVQGKVTEVQLMLFADVLMIMRMPSINR